MGEGQGQGADALADADVADLALLDELLELLPGGEGVVGELLVVHGPIAVERDRPVDQEQVEVRRVERLQARVQRLLHIARVVVVVPQL